MPDNKVKSQYLENSERQRMAVIKDMERNPSPMTKAFLRPAYDGTEACPIYCRRPTKANTNLEYLEKTVMAYSDKVKRHLVKQFIQHGIATKQTDTSGQLYIEGLETVDISEKTLSEQLVTCIHQSKRAGYALEKWEFLKDYKYSVIFTCDDFSSTLKKAKEIIPLENTYENDYLYTSFVKPVAYSMDGYYFLKFNLAYAAIHPLTQEEFLTKYPFLVVFHEKGELIEFRFDVLKRVFLSDKKEPTIYSNLIAEMSDYFKEHFECDLIPLNFVFSLFD